MTENDKLLNDLWEFGNRVLGVYHVCDVEATVYGGWNNSQRAWAVATEIGGSPAVVVDASYVKWTPADLIERYLHEVGHHKHGDVPTGRIRAYLVANPAQPTPAAVKASEQREARAWAFAKAQRPRFEAWRKQKQLDNLQRDVDEIFAMLGLPPRRVK